MNLCLAPGRLISYFLPEWDNAPPCGIQERQHQHGGPPAGPRGSNRCKDKSEFQSGHVPTSNNNNSNNNNNIQPLSILRILLFKDGLTPLHCAARSGHDPAVEILLERGAPILARTKVEAKLFVDQCRMMMFDVDLKAKSYIKIKHLSFPVLIFILQPSPFTFSAPHRTDCLRCTCQRRETT